MPLSRDKLRSGLLPLIARLLLTAEFTIAVNGKITDWSGQAGYMASHGMTMIAPLLGIVSVRLHDFWNIADPARAGGAQVQFFKNLGMMGGLLMVAAYGPGRWALGTRDNAQGA